MGSFGGRAGNGSFFGRGGTLSGRGGTFAGSLGGKGGRLEPPLGEGGVCH